MKIMDENGRIGGKISIVDIIVILLCILVVCAIFVKYNNDDTRAANVDSKTITYTVKIRGLREGTVNAMKKGDELRENLDDNVMGKIEDIKVEPATLKMNLNNGTWIDAPLENRYDVELTLKTKADLSGGHIYVNRVHELNVNASITLLSKYVQFTGLITGIQTT